MTSARDEFEQWRQHKLAELARERDTLSARCQGLEARRPAPRSAGAVGEEIARDLKAFLQRHQCVEGTLEMVRRGAPRGPYYDEVLYARRADGRPDTFFNFLQEPFGSRAREFLEEQPGDCEFLARLDGATQHVEVTVVDGPALQHKRELKELEEALSRLDGELKRFRELALSTEPFGLELAWRVVRSLKKAGALHYSHRDYCGMGLFALEDGSFVYASVWDGHFFEQDVVRRFEEEERLARWLAQQSDASLSNYGDGGRPFLNQTLTRERLEAFAGS
ncbi:hypothetical protein [Archangium sp.]|uniref:hypothetical protein n=1 Tax=Archangium sp. TaxID=1872627 RepID=UPI00286B47AA|nr:hypothetical protein [Archangium sp.]